MDASEEKCVLILVFRFCLTLLVFVLLGAILCDIYEAYRIEWELRLGRLRGRRQCFLCGKTAESNHRSLQKENPNNPSNVIDADQNSSCWILQVVRSTSLKKDREEKKKRKSAGKTEIPEGLVSEKKAKSKSKTALVTEPKVEPSGADSAAAGKSTKKSWLKSLFLGSKCSTPKEETSI